jgi:hypothetical protein
MASDNFDFGFKIQSICSIEQWSWVPLLGPHLGGLLGALIYTLFIEAHWPDDREVEGNYYKIPFRKFILAYFSSIVRVKAIHPKNIDMYSQYICLLLLKNCRFKRVEEARAESHLCWQSQNHSTLLQTRTAASSHFQCNISHHLILFVNCAQINYYLYVKVPSV